MSDDLDNADKETRLMLEATLSNVDTEVPDNIIQVVVYGVKQKSKTIVGGVV